MIVRVCQDRQAAGKSAAEHAASLLRTILRDNGTARIVGASAASQIEFLNALVKAPDIAWENVELFQLDEYIGLPFDHPARFRAFLDEHLISKTAITRCHLLTGDGETSGIIRRGSEAINAAPVDIAFVGIGENGHLAFNDPPADFDIEEPYIIVSLDDACRQQQVGEGWFPTLADVPTEAISMSVRQIMKAKNIIAIVPGRQKAQAVHECFERDISPLHPASILRTHGQTTVYLDEDSAALLNPDTRFSFSGQNK